MKSPETEKQFTARKLGLVGCHACSRLARAGQQHCQFCQAHLHSRKPASLQRTWALLATAVVLLVPAMTLPVSIVHSLGEATPSTIMDSVIYFFQNGALPVAVVIFVASILVPLFKILGLSFLLISVQAGLATSRVQRTRLYRMIEFVGRWSMIDVFVVAILVALVHFGIFLNINPGKGIGAFAGVVVLTMLASMSFDPRLIWDEK